MIILDITGVVLNGYAVSVNVRNDAVALSDNNNRGVNRTLVLDAGRDDCGLGCEQRNRSRP